MPSPDVISVSWETSTSLAVDYIESARTTWARSRKRCARELQRARERARRCKARAYREAYSQGLLDGRRDATKALKNSLEEAAKRYEEIEFATREHVLAIVHKALTFFVKDGCTQELSLSKYVKGCLSQVPATSELSVRAHPCFIHELQTEGIPAIADDKIPIDFVDVVLPVGTLRFAWFRDLQTTIASSYPNRK